MIKFRRKVGKSYVVDNIYTKEEVDRLIEDAVQRTMVISWRNIPNRPEDILGAVQTPNAPTICQQVDSLLIEWTNPGSAETYDLIREEVPSGDVTIVASDISATNFSDTVPEGNPTQDYKYAVRGKNSDGLSEYSPYSATESYNSATVC